MSKYHAPFPRLTLLGHPPWNDYELIDSGDGKKLERFGRYRLVRPETQAIWSPTLPSDDWERIDAFFERRQEDDGPGRWVMNHALPEQWLMQFENISFWARLTPFRHTGVFPEHSAHWEWIRQRISHRSQQPNVLVLFGYTGLTTLVAAEAGARVCHVDASKPATRWAQENQAVSQLEDRPIRWIVDDVIKFVKREGRRGSRYDLIVMDPPVFGRGPKGEVWRLEQALPELILVCRQILSKNPIGILVNTYATTMSSVTLYNVLASAMHSFAGEVAAGELILVDSTVSRSLSTALFARWSRQDENEE